MHSIYLCGLMGSGLTAMSRHIADITSKRCIIPEILIANKLHMSSQQLCEIYGIDNYIYIEEDCLHNICQMENAVVPLDIHTLFDENNIMKIKQSGCLIYLYQPYDVFVKRLSSINKASMLNKLTQEQLLDIYTRWHTICKISANHIIDMNRSHKKQLYKLFGRFE